MPESLKFREWEEILSEIDKDGNDEINFEEFLTAMEKVIHPEITPNTLTKAIKKTEESYIKEREDDLPEKVPEDQEESKS